MKADETKALWDWIDRPLPESFFKTAGHLKKWENERCWNEIPAEIKPLAYAMIVLAQENAKRGLGGKTPHSCLAFRCLIYDLSEKLRKEGLDLHLPYSWFMDGPMIEPEWIVRITNGIIGWTCDSSVKECGALDGAFICRFCDPKEAKKNDSKSP